MFIQKKLIKEINKVMFKKDKNYKALTDKSSIKEIRKIDSALAWDLINIKRNVKIFLETDFALELVQEQKQAENMIILFIDKHLSKETKIFIQTLAGLEGNAWIVGGFVRDVLRGKTPKDIDFCSNIPYKTIKETFTQLGWETKDTGKQFLVCNVIAPNKETFEVAMLRNNGAEIGTLEEDAQRRDFTCNACYFDINNNEIKDPNGTALEDIKNNILRFVGKPNDRIKEDPLRIMRGYRMISEGWNPTPKTLRSFRRKFEHLIKEASSTRILKEIEKTIGINND